MTLSIMTVPRMWSDVEAQAPEEQKKVLAVLAAYNEGHRHPMPWALLVRTMRHLQETNHELALGKSYDGDIERALYQVVQNLQQLDFVTSGPDGTSFTHPGTEMLAEWNGSFAARKTAAAGVLRTLGLLPA